MREENRKKREARIRDKVVYKREKREKIRELRREKKEEIMNTREEVKERREDRGGKSEKI